MSATTVPTYLTPAQVHQLVHLNNCGNVATIFIVVAVCLLFLMAGYALHPKR